MNVSFVIYFHSQRINNLKQTIRFLKKREDLSNCEFILVCQDRCFESFDNATLINLNSDTYYKSKMCNIGVKKAKNNLIALLDSDRIFPNNYFGRICQKIKPGQFVSTWKMYKLNAEYTDDQIENNNVEKIEDFKSVKNKTLCKNLFAGNTVFYKKDYLNSGGMDEQFIGYGFTDTDMTRNIIHREYEVIWREDEEIHLYHDKHISVRQENTSPEIFTAYNAVKYYKKWGIPVEKEAKEFINYTISNNKCTQSVRKKLKKLFYFDLFLKV